jgi:nucleoside-diphosphate-sugar epimerase
VAPENEYEKTKTDSDQLVSAAAGPATFSATILRPSNVFGPKMSNRSLFQMIAMISKGIYFVIGQPCASANYVYVDNIVDGMLRCATLPQARGRTLILSDHRSLEEFVAAIADVLGRPAPRFRVAEPLVHVMATIFGAMPGFPLTTSRVDALTDRVVYSALRISEELHYVHNVSMEDGVHRVVHTWKQSQ